MAQAKTLTNEELTRVLEYIKSNRYAQRNRAILLLTHLAGLRIGEVACLRWSDVVTSDGIVKDEIRLLPDMTKGRHARTAFINKRLREELQSYADAVKCVDLALPSFLKPERASNWVQCKPSLAQTVPCSTKVQELKEPAATVAAGRS